MSSLLHLQQQQDQEQVLLHQQQHIHHLQKVQQQLQQQQRTRNINLEALGLLKRGDCGAAFLRWRQALSSIRDPSQDLSKATDTTAAYYTQECIRSVEMHPELVAQINARACPENMFPMFCRTFTVTSTTAPNTVSQVIDSSVVLYNVGFAYHLAAMSNDARQRFYRMEQAYCFYSAAEKGLSDLFALQDITTHHSYPMMLMVALAVSTNKGHFHSLLLQNEALQQCRDRITAIHRLLVNIIAKQTASIIAESSCRRHRRGQQHQATESRLALPTTEEKNYITATVFEATSLPTFKFAASMA